MAHLDKVKRFLACHTLAINVAINILLGLICLASYASIFALYLSKGMQIRPFTLVVKGSVTPTATVALFGILLSGATSAILIRATEHSLWSRIMSRKLELHNSKDITAREAYQQAQWTFSPFARLAYIFQGRAWTLRLGGLFLFGTSALNPILLYGIRPGNHAQIDDILVAPSQPAFLGFLLGDDLFNPKIGANSSMMISALASMSNLSAPVANICPNASCSAVASVTALQANCVPKTHFFADLHVFNDTFFDKHCSEFGNRTCITINRSITMSFTSGPSDLCSHILDHTADARSIFPAGDFMVIYGMWYSKSTNAEANAMHSIDCQVTHGNVSIVQNGRNKPTLDRSSFVRSEAPIPYHNASGNNDVWFSQNYYLSNALPMDGSLSSPYTFSDNPSEQCTTLNPMGLYLVAPAHEANINDSARVARSIEANFDMATLFAFAKSPHSARIEYTYTNNITILTYDSRVLAILVFPFLAAVLVLSKRWRVHGNDVLIGHDPIAIAERADEILRHSRGMKALGGKEQAEAATKPADDQQIDGIPLTALEGSNTGSTCECHSPGASHNQILDVCIGGEGAQCMTSLVIGMA